MNSELTLNMITLDCSLKHLNLLIFLMFHSPKNIGKNIISRYALLPIVHFSETNTLSYLFLTKQKRYFIETFYKLFQQCVCTELLSLRQPPFKII